MWSLSQGGLLFKQLPETTLEIGAQAAVQPFQDCQTIPGRGWSQCGAVPRGDQVDKIRMHLVCIYYIPRDIRNYHHKIGSMNECITVTDFETIVLDFVNM